MKNKVIAFDAKKALLNFTGLGNYSRYAIEAMASVYPDNRYLLVSHKFLPDDRLNSLLSLPNVEVVTPDTKLGRSMPGLWRLRGGITRRMRREGVDLYHGLSNELPLDIAGSGIPSVVTIHDLIFRTFPDNYKPIDRRLYDFKFHAAARNATRIIAISRRTRHDIERFYHIPAEKTDVVYQGCNPLFTKPVPADAVAIVKSTYSLPSQYIICVGTVEQRKNQELLINALPMLPEQINVVIVGRGRNGYDSYLHRLGESLGVNRRVRYLTGVPTEHLPALYHEAAAAAYPSRYEGFGLPMLEALSTGTPVIAATGSCLEEAGGEGALYVNPLSADDFATKAMAIINDTSLRHKLVEAGTEHLSQFTKENFARQVAATYQRAMDSSASGTMPSMSR
ncbi:MAG: glycosyltransferase family 4 protein [Paramuribaculum sp.]|nr:glycosyltransferase family 4 protein [Paramuribaculum sp.]